MQLLVGYFTFFFVLSILNPVLNNHMQLVATIIGQHRPFLIRIFLMARNNTPEVGKSHDQLIWRCNSISKNPAPAVFLLCHPHSVGFALSQLSSWSQNGCHCSKSHVHIQQHPAEKEGMFLHMYLFIRAMKNLLSPLPHPVSQLTLKSQCQISSHAHV